MTRKIWALEWFMEMHHQLGTNRFLSLVFQPFLFYLSDYPLHRRYQHSLRKPVSCLLINTEPTSKSYLIRLCSFHFAFKKGIRFYAAQTLVIWIRTDLTTVLVRCRPGLMFVPASAKPIGILVNRVCPKGHIQTLVHSNWEKLSLGRTFALERSLNNLLTLVCPVVLLVLSLAGEALWLNHRWTHPIISRHTYTIFVAMGQS